MAGYNAVGPVQNRSYDDKHSAQYKFIVKHSRYSQDAEQ
jgi:hypothetical protein